MENLAEYFSMGGYGHFVWPAYGLAILVMLLLVIAAWRSLHARERELLALNKAFPGRRGRLAPLDQERS